MYTLLHSITMEVEQKLSRNTKSAAACKVKYDTIASIQTKKSKSKFFIHMRIQLPFQI